MKATVTLYTFVGLASRSTCEMLGGGRMGLKAARVVPDGG